MLFTVCKYLHYISSGDIQFEKCVKYANEITDDVSRFAAQSIKTWQANSSTGNTSAAIKNLFPWQLTLFQSPPT